MKFIRKQKNGNKAEIKIAKKKSPTNLPPWKVLIVDDEIDVHTMTQIGLKDFQFDDRALQILQAMSAIEAQKILQNETDIAVAFIDVVMETDDAGLHLVDFIRNHLQYSLIRLIIRTGQPGVAPEREVIERYDIDDYKSKTELTDDKLYTTTRSTIKSYRDLVTLDSNRRALRKILETVPEFHHAQSLNQFFSGILTQLIGLCNLGENSLISTVNSGLVVTTDNQHQVKVQSGTGRFAKTEPAKEEIEKIRQICLKKILGEMTELSSDVLLLPLEIEQKLVGFVYLENAQHLSQADLDLIQIMAQQCTSALENLRLYIELKEANQKTLQMLEEAKKARQDAEIANQAKSQFLANMSHELRTPLNAIIGYSEILEETAEDLNQTEEFLPDLQKIHTAGRNLLGLINDVLDLSKIEAGKMDLFLETVELNTLLKEITATIKPLNEKKANTLTIELDEQIKNIHTDLTKLRQMLLNLMSNAVKFTEKGQINLEIKLDGEWITFCVIDNGVGMTIEQQRKLFEPFTQGDSSMTRRYGGTGLGLTITQKFVKILGGTLWVESEFGHGSTFVLSLPITTKITTTQVETETFRKKEGIILVIDDDSTVRKLFQNILSKLGYAVAVAANGEQGLELADKLRPDCILLDIYMLELDGWKILAKLKKDSRLAPIPVIMMSTNIDKQQACANGAIDCLNKKLLHSQLSFLLEKYHIGESSFDILVVDDEKYQRDVFSAILESEGLKVLVAENGQVALTLLEHNKLPALILLDLSMPVMDGFELLEHLQTNEQWHVIPVIVVTSRELSAEEQMHLTKQVNTIFHKGNYRREELILHIRQLVDNSLTQ